MIDAPAMTKLQEVRDQSGTRYAAAVAELHAAWVDLAGIDQMLENGHFKTHQPVMSFGSNPDTFKLLLIHPIYCPNVGVNWVDEIHARRDALVKRGIPDLGILPA
jgi:hypothetical protein